MSGPPPSGILLDQSTKKPEDEKQESYGRDCYKRWMDEIEAAKKVFKPWHERGKKIIKLYKDERVSTQSGDSNSHRMNILWSNIQTLQPAIYSKTPKPNIARRYADDDPVARCASLIMERCLNASLELCDFDYPMKRARDDYLLPGRGTVWVRYDPKTAMTPIREPLQQVLDDKTGQQVYRPIKGGDIIPDDKAKKDDDGNYYYETDPESIKLEDGLAVDHVMWLDFLHEPVNDWTKVTWASKKVLMKRPQLVRKFGDKGKQVKLTKVFDQPPTDSNSDATTTGKPDCAEVWEIWCEPERKVYWISDGLVDDVLDEQPDFLKLSTFWPFPRPLTATTSTDSLVPVPDYSLYQDQAEQLDRLTDRIRLLIKALRVVGFYDGSVPELQQLLEETEENAMVPVASFIAFAQNGGMKGLVDWLPIEQIANVLAQLFQARAQIKQDLYEVTGISDVIRGQSNPQETATAQQIKSNFGTLRLQDRQTEMSRLCRDVIRIMGEIQVEHYDPERLIEMSAIQNTKDGKDPNNVLKALQLLKDDKLRSFRIDVETDATVAPDQDAEKQSRIEFLGAVTPFIEKAAMAAQQFPQLQPLVLDMLKFGVAGFRAGRTMEASIDEMAAQLAQQQGQPQQEKPDPAMEKVKGELQIKQAQVQADQQATQAKAQSDAAEITMRQKASEAEMAQKKAESDARIRLIDAQITELEAKMAAAQAQANAAAQPQQVDPLAQQRQAYEAQRLNYDQDVLAVDHQELQARRAKIAQQMQQLNGSAQPQ
jgi:hypothetical protein